jgi:hemerythrin
MALMAWKDDFTLGIPAMDQQHQQLIEQINRLDDAVRISIRNPAIPGILTALVHCTTSHFENEEKLLRETGFTELDGHLEIHQKLLRAVTDVMEKVKSGKLSASANLAAFLHFWLEKHIMDYDQQYARHIARLKTAGAAK